MEVEYVFPTQQDIERAEAHLRRVELEERAAREQIEAETAELHQRLHGSPIEGCRECAK